MSNFHTYSKFHSQQEADSFIDLLQNSNIDFEVEYEKNVLDKIYIGETLDPMIAIRIPESRFEEVNKLLLTQAESQLTNIDPSYYLYSFTDEELMNVLNNPDEWNFFDQALAAKLLADRKVEIPKQIDKLNAKDAYMPSKLGALGIIIEYIFSIFLAYVGIIIGFATIFSFKTLSNGKKVKMYDDSTRTHGKIMIAISIVRTLLPWFY